MPTVSTVPTVYLGLNHDEKLPVVARGAQEADATRVVILTADHLKAR